VLALGNKPVTETNFSRLMLESSSIIYDMNQLSTARQVQVLAALSVEQLEMNLPEVAKEEVRNT
jgi:hypothetical protein